MDKQWFGFTTWLLVVAFFVAGVRSASASNDVRLRARIEAAHLTATTVVVGLTDGSVLRGRVARLADTTFVLGDDSGGFAEIAFASVTTVKSDRKKWIIIAAVAAAVVVFLKLYTQCFYRC